jgi:lipoprotein-anchoring transpeptidase ErfK/SrfK
MFKKLSVIIVAVAMMVTLIPASFAFAENGEAGTVIAAPTDVKASCKSDSNNVTVTWNASENAVKYIVYKSKTAATPDKAYKYVKGLKLKDNNQKGGKYHYWIVAVAQDKTRSEASEPATVKVNDYLTTAIRGIKWKGKIKKTMRLKGQTLKKGTKVRVTKHSKVILFFEPKKVYIIGKSTSGNTVKGWVKLTALKNDRVYGDVSYSKKKKKVLDWTESVKEKYVNDKKYSSSTNKLIWTSTYTQRVYIFHGKKGHWKLDKSFRCTTGKFSNPTTRKQYTIRRHQMRRQRVNKRSGLRYYYTHLSYFKKGDAFHTISWRIPDGKIIKKVHRKAQPQTLGCVRLNVPNSKYIYYHVPIGTKVVIY